MRYLAGLTAILALSACTLPNNSEWASEWNKEWGSASAPGQTVAITSLPGWSQANTATALSSFVISCKALMLMPPDTALGGSGITQQRGGQAGQWAPACTAAKAVPPNDEAAARQFFQSWFNVFVVSHNATISGYFEPEMDGSKNERPGYTVPLYAKPALASLANLPRTAINSGALYRKAPVTAYVRSEADAFMLQVQGSGRLRLPNGQVLSVGFNGQNNQPYTPIGAILVKMGALAPDNVSYQSISDWLHANPAQADAIMEQNQNYVYLRPLGYLPADEGAPGTLGVPLTPQHSVAIDRTALPLGAPLFIATSNPLTGAPINLLAIAQDTGAGLQGANQADLFFGSGPSAEAIAGHMHQAGTIYILLPRDQPQP